MRQLWFASIVLGLGAFAVAPGCGGNKGTSGFNTGGASGGGNESPDGAPDFFGEGGLLGPGGDGSLSTGDGAPGVCENLQCQQHTCGTTNGGSTTITGTVYDPAGKNPLYDVVVYVPNTATDAITTGVTSASCSCDSLYSGQPIASALTGPDGKFTLKNAPDGANIPLVVQVGKWRTQLKIPTVTKCANNDLDTLLPSKVTLPGKAGISAVAGPTLGLQQDIPSIAVSTGGADSLECLLLRAGVDASEYTGGAGGTGHIHIFQGCDGQTCSVLGGLKNIGPAPNTSPPGPAADQKLWDSATDIDPYDIVLLSCEGTNTTNPNSPILSDYVSAGGRVFAEHYHYAWFTDGANAVAPFPDDLATWNVLNGAYSSAINASVVETLAGGGGFPKGIALYQWLGNVGALTGNVDAGTGELPIAVARGDALVSGANTKSQAWIQSAASVAPASTQYFSFDMPFNPPLNDAGLPNYCGRVVFSDLHIGAAANDYNGDTANPSGHTDQLTTPSGCTTGDLSPDEKALEFMLFDLSSCVTPVTVTPQPPPPTPPIK